jgi:hypothetical protein
MMIILSRSCGFYFHSPGLFDVNLLRAPNKDRAFKEAYFVSGLRQAAKDNAEQKPACPSAPKRKRSFSVLLFILLGTLRRRYNQIFKQIFREGKTE